jgi:hypothetical protein
LGSFTKEADGDSNTFTIFVFKRILRTLRTTLKLTMLDMQLPDVTELEFSGMGTHLLFNLGLNSKGAELVAQNINNLTKLRIGRQWSDSDSNSIGYVGATAIAKGLKSLTSLNICKQ